MFEKCKLKKKIKMLKKEISSGNLQSMYDLAMIYLDGSIIRKEEQKAIELLQSAANQGHLQSKTFLVSKKISSSFVIGAKAISEIQSIFNK